MKTIKKKGGGHYIETQKAAHEALGTKTINRNVKLKSKAHWFTENVIKKRYF